MKKFNTFCVVLVALSLSLSSCKMPARATSRTTQIDPQAQFTAAALTAEAKRAQLLLNMPTSSPATLTPAAIPTETAPKPTATGPVAATVIVPTNAPPSTSDRGEFVTDVTVPDGTIYAPNQAFTKTWRLKNAGTSTWTTGYSLVFISGVLMSGSAYVPLSKDVLPGQMVDVSVNLVAPLTQGIFQGFWKLKNANGQIFGVGPAAADPIWLIISVSELAPTSGSSTIVPSGLIITEALMMLDNPSLAGACPQTFTFTIKFTLSKAATVTYVMEAGSDAGAEIKLPPPSTHNLDAGPHTIVYELTFSTSLRGWARLRFTAPEDVVSNQVNFTLVCQ